MKKSFILLLTVIILCTLSSCGLAAVTSSTDEQSSSENRYDQETDSIQNNDNADTLSQVENDTQSEIATETKDKWDTDSTEYSIERLNGSIRVPNGYHVFGEDQNFTEQMCEDIGVRIENMENAIPMLQGQTLIVPAGEPYADSVHFYLKVKEKKYDDITLSKLSISEYNMLASTIVSSFGVHDYDTVEENGLRFFVFTANQGLGDVLRYATILNGHMIYVYANIGENTLSEQQRSDLEYIAFSIQHAL